MFCRILLVLMLAQVATAFAVPMDVSNSRSKTFFTQHTEIYEDTTGKVTIEDIVSEESSVSFKQVTQQSVNLGITDSALWVHFQLSNSSDKPVEVVIVNRYASTDYMDYYLKDMDGNFTVKRTGDRYTSEDKNIMFRLPSVSIKVPPGTHDYYFRQATKGVLQVDLLLWPIDIFQEMRAKDYILITFLLSVLVVMLVYNLILAMTIRDRNYVFYVAYIASSLLSNASSSGFFQQLLPDFPWAANEGYLYAGSGLALFTELFTMSFLELRTRFRFGFWWGVISICVTITQIMIIPFDYGLASKIIILGGMNISLLALVSGLALSFKGFRPAYWFTLAWGSLLFGTIVFMLALRGVISVNSLASWAYFIGSALEVILLTFALGDKTKLLQKKSESDIKRLNEDLTRQNYEINSLNSTLEQKVKEKVQSIRSILESIELGIFTIKKDFKIADEFSKYMFKLFPNKKIAGENVENLLFKNNNNLSSDQLSQTITAIDFSLGEDELVFEANRHSLVDKLNIDINGESHHLQLDWNSIVNNQEVESLLVSIKDVTSLEKLEFKAKNQEKELEYISEIINIDETKCQSFFNSCRSFMKESYRLLQGSSEFDTEIMKILFINAHTMKGAARALQFQNLSEVIHKWEQYLANVKSKIEDWSMETAMVHYKIVNAEIETYEKINYERLGRQRNSTNKIVLSSDEGESLISYFNRHQELAEESIPLQIYKSVRSQLFSPAKSVIKDIAYMLGSLSRDLKKPEPELHINGTNVSLSNNGQEVLRNCIVHLFRNSMDHGIEDPKERVFYEKSKIGNIYIDLCLEESGLIIEYRDDGCGLDISAIAELARIKDIISRDSKPTEDEIALLIFEQGFSTTTTVSQISGRGVGMAAIKQYLDDIGGSITVNLLDNKQAHPLLHERGYRSFSLRAVIPPSHFIHNEDSTFERAA